MPQLHRRIPDSLPVLATGARWRDGASHVSTRDLDLSTLVGEQHRRGLARLRFTRYVEEQFRQHYADLNYPKVRPLLVIVTLAVVFLTGFGLARDNITPVTATFGLAVLMPLLMATLMASYQRERHYLYQPLLAASTLLTGLIVTSVTLRASLHGTPYYFATEVAWIMIVWLISGLLFWYAATTALTITATYIWGLFHWKFGLHETAFEAILLAAVNAVGALCCFQLEVTARQSFRNKGILEDLAERDGLTGLYNRRAYNAYMERIWRQSRRDGGQITIMLFDIDHFKAYNDLYGHQAGDDALKRVAKVISLGAQRPLDCAARLGGEEMSLVLYGPPSDFSRELPQHLRQRVETMEIPHAESGASRFLTVSVGVAVVAANGERSLKGAIQLADEALYQAKEDGRNRVVVKDAGSSHIETGRFRADRKRAVGS
ncbi:MAG: diguanylate cyclase [Gammaproteobacteria bacterium]|nr:diguanylate cyclase [Gammaproteobacteria bacterium]